MPRILSVNNGPFSFSSSILSLEKNNLEEYYEVSANTSVLNEGESVLFSFQYRNITTTKTIYWEIVPSANITYEDFSTLMNGTFQIVNSDVEKVTITSAKDFTNIAEEITETFNIRFRENNSSGNILLTSSEVDILDTSYLAVGQQEFTTPGTYTFTVPERVNRISFVLIGGGGGGVNLSTGQNGASGGGLIYCNSLSVNEGQEIYIMVGNRGTDQSSSEPVTNGGNSFLIIDYNTSSPKTIQANGGTHAGAGVVQIGGTTSSNSYFSTNSANVIGRNGGNGGGPGFYPGSSTYDNGGAGSAAGYSSNGVNGGKGGTPGSNGSGGSGGSGAGRYNGAGGGTGIYGQGTAGAGGIYQISTFSADNQSGKAGSKIGSEVFRQYGGGGSNLIGLYRSGGQGAVRIIWPGQLRQYPVTRTADETPIP